ncbi:hypothetical protein D9M72_608270 [compost metagenome]
MSRWSTELCVPTNDVGNCMPEAIPHSSMNKLLTTNACGGLNAMPVIAMGISEAPVRIIGL